MIPKSNNAPVFSGKFRHVMDAKHRITIPACWRNDGHVEFFVVPAHANDHLLGYTGSAFEEVSRLVEENSTIPPSERRIFVRQFYSKAQICPLDRQGRILLADDSLKTAGIESDLLLIGTFNRFEIWNPDRWNQVSEDEQKVFSRVATMIGL